MRKPGDLKGVAVPAARDFLKAVRKQLGQRESRDEITQDELADRLGVDRSMVGRWEGNSGAEPSYPHLCRVFMLLNVVGKDLLPHTARNVESPAMSNIESKLLAELRRLPEAEQLEVFAHVIRLAKDHEAPASQTPAALKKG
jgi:transcriptional regulator with XRE-family HTH domain